MSEEIIDNDKFTSLNQVKITDVIYQTLKHWPWLLVSLALCMGVAVLYIMRTQPIYTRNASVLIKGDTGDGSGGGADYDALARLGIVSTYSNIMDEINKLCSPDVMEEVVKRLNLNTVYAIEDEFRNNVIYGTSLPISVKFPTLTESGNAHVNVKIYPDGTYTLSDISFNGESAKSTSKGKVKLGQSTQTTGGTIEVSATPYYVPGTEYSILVNRKSLSGAVKEFSGKLVVNRKNEDGKTIVITINDQSTQRAEDLLNTLIDVYNEKWIEDRNQVAVSTSNFINERLVAIEQELGSVDTDISSFQSSNLITDGSTEATNAVGDNKDATAKILNLGMQLQMSRYMRSYLANELNKNTLLPVNSGLGSGTVEGQIAAYNEIMLKRNQYESNSSASNPTVIDLDAQLAGMRSVILSTIDTHITYLESQMREMQSVKSGAVAKIAAGPSIAKELLTMERQQKVKEQLYLFLLRKREENELSKAFTAYNTQVINRPAGSNAPVSPMREKILLVAFGLGLAFPFGINYLLLLNNSKVRGRKDIEDLTIPFMGEIPDKKPKKGEPVTSRIVVKHGRRDVINEAFRVLRTNLSFMTAGDAGCKVIMITSFNPGSGKTFLTMNLGVSLALNGKKVLVIDGDMRRGSTSAYIGSPAKGMSNYLVGETDDVNSIIVADTINKNLSVLPVGTIPPNPTELLESERFTELVKELRSHYDYIFIDCPPVELMADAQIIETVVDRTIFIVRAGLLERSMLPELERLYNDKKYRNMGIVLNATVAEGSRYGYKYGYGYRYGYGYGYGNYGHYTSTKEK